MESARDAILHLLTEYCFAVDRGDFDTFAQLFERGRFEIEGDPTGPKDGTQAVRAMLDKVTLYDGQPLSKHVLSNVQIDIHEGGDTASAQSYISVYQAVPPDFPLQVIFIGHYRDRFARDSAGWYFTHRLITRMLVGDLSRHRADMA